MSVAERQHLFTLNKDKFLWNLLSGLNVRNAIGAMSSGIHM